MGVRPCKARHPYLDTILNDSEQILIGHPLDFGEPGSTTQEMHRPTDGRGFRRPGRDMFHGPCRQVFPAEDSLVQS